MSRLEVDLSPEERDHLTEWMLIHMSPTATVKEKEATRLAKLASLHFGLGQDCDAIPSWVISMADDVVGTHRRPVASLVVTERFNFSRDDLMDIAFWVGRTDEYPASAVQVSKFIRSVVRGNLDELNKERCPPPTIKVKRRK